MRALCWHGKGDVRVDTVPDPKILHPRDAIIKITACAICGSDLHLLDGYQPTMESGDILGHENMGEVIELGSEVTNLKIGDRVVGTRARGVQLTIGHAFEYVDHPVAGWIQVDHASPPWSPERGLESADARTTRDSSVPTQSCRCRLRPP